MRLKIFATIFACLFTILAGAQKKLTLEEAIQLATKESISLFKAQNKYMASSWRFHNHKANFLPSLTLTSNPLDYQKSFTKVYNYEENRDEYIDREYINSSLGIRILQNIGLTGGQISLNSNFNRNTSLNPSFSDYNSNPLQINLYQPISSYNELKWNKKIEPIKYKEAKQNLLYDIQQITSSTVNYFFNVIKAQNEVETAQANLESTTELHKIGKGRYHVGTITLNDLYNLELNVLNSEIALTKAKLQLEQEQSVLKSFLSISESEEFDYVIPTETSKLIIEPQTALEKATIYNPSFVGFERRLLEAEANVKKSKSEAGLQASINASIGLNNSNENFGESMTNLQDKQVFGIQLNVPILDWGKKKGIYSMAQFDKKVVELEIEQSKIDFKQNLTLQVKQFNLQNKQIESAKKANEIAKKSYEVSVQRFKIGKVEIVQLNQSLASQNTAQSQYINALSHYWRYFYEIKKLTLFDFENSLPLIEGFDSLLEELK